MRVTFNKHSINIDAKHSSSYRENVSFQNNFWKNKRLTVKAFSSKFELEFCFKLLLNQLFNSLVCNFIKRCKEKVI